MILNFLLKVAVTSRDLKIQAKWNDTLISAYPQCVDQLILDSSYGEICQVSLNQNSCDSNRLQSVKDKVCDNQVEFGLILVNEDHKDGVQNVRAPALTQIQDLCSGNPSVSIETSDNCQAVIPKWIGEPSVEYLKGRRGFREIKMKWRNEDLSGFFCLQTFEVKYWPRGKASRSFVTSAIEAKREETSAYSTMLEVDECQEYTYVIRAAKSNPSVVVNHRGSFKSKCKEIVARKSSSTTRKPTTTSTTTTSTTSKSTTSTTTTTTTTTTTGTTTSTTTTPIRTTTTISSTTETTRLTSMLFNPVKVTTETDKTLEDLLFKEDEETPRLPKTSVESFQGSVTTTASSSTNEKSVGTSEKSVEIQATFNVTEAEYQLMNDEPYEYIESNIEEDAKYLESAIGLPDYDQGKHKSSIFFNNSKMDFFILQSNLKAMKCTMKMLQILMNCWQERKDPKKRIQDP